MNPIPKNTPLRYNYCPGKMRYSAFGNPVCKPTFTDVSDAASFVKTLRKEVIERAVDEK